MTRTISKYINLFTDFGFKKIFGEEVNKDLLMAFLNDLLEGSEFITELTYLKNEQLGRNEGERKAVYDLYCTNDKGEKFIVEVQRVKQEYFKDRTLYYSTFAIQEQAEKGKNWGYELKAVYTIAIMDFVFDNIDKDHFQHRVKLMDIDKKSVFYDKLTFIYLEVPKFEKSLDELSTNFERWLFAFRNLHRLHEMPNELQEGVFLKLFEQAEIARMDNRDRNVYEESLKDYWDLKSSMDTYYNDGFSEGLEQGIEQGLEQGIEQGIEQGLEQGIEQGFVKSQVQIVINSYNQGLSVEVISQITQLPVQEINRILEQNGSQQA